VSGDARLGPRKTHVTKVKALLRQLEHLSVKDRKELARRLQGSVRQRTVRRQPQAGAYASLLELAGTADSEFSDVSTHKNKHLSDIYARRLP
jgi:hypothetical protein